MSWVDRPEKSKENLPALLKNLYRGSKNHQGWPFFFTTLVEQIKAQKKYSMESGYPQDETQWAVRAVQDTKQSPTSRGQNFKQNRYLAPRRSSQPLLLPHCLTAMKKSGPEALPSQESEEKANRFRIIWNVYQGKFTCTVSEQRKVLDNLSMSKMKRNDMSTMNSPQTHDKISCKWDKDHNIKHKPRERKKLSYRGWHSRKT